MKLNHRFFSPLLLLVFLTICLSGCTGSQILGGAAFLAVGAATADPLLAIQAGLGMHAALEAEGEKQFFLSQVPTDLRRPGDDAYKTDEGNWIYKRPDDFWLQWSGGKWVDPNAADTLVAVSAPPPTKNFQAPTTATGATTPR